MAKAGGEAKTTEKFFNTCELKFDLVNVVSSLLCILLGNLLKFFRAENLLTERLPALTGNELQGDVHFDKHQEGKVQQ